MENIGMDFFLTKESVYAAGLLRADRMQGFMYLPPPPFSAPPRMLYLIVAVNLWPQVCTGSFALKEYHAICW